MGGSVSLCTYKHSRALALPLALTLQQMCAMSWGTHFHNSRVTLHVETDSWGNQLSNRKGSATKHLDDTYQTFSTLDKPPCAIFKKLHIEPGGQIWSLDLIKGRMHMRKPSAFRAEVIGHLFFAELMASMQNKTRETYVMLRCLFY